MGHGFHSFTRGYLPWACWDHKGWFKLRQVRIIYTSEPKWHKPIWECKVFTWTKWFFHKPESHSSAARHHFGITSRHNLGMYITLYDHNNQLCKQKCLSYHISYNDVLKLDKNNIYDVSCDIYFGDKQSPWIVKAWTWGGATWGTNPTTHTQSRRPGALAEVFKGTSYTLMARPRSQCD